MQNETKGAKFIRGLVKFVFIGCYAAFLWASIHHVATFFDHFEQNGASNTFGSYLLAGAIDITALVTTIGVMFFRKSMPKGIQAILWVFILGLSLYSFFINWEYASHFQNSDLILQPTGETQAVYDASGQLHYVPVMSANSWLLYVNPAFASCFAIFALIYSVVGEFFGTSAPTAEELRARRQYLSETADVLEDIRRLEESRRKPRPIGGILAAGREQLFGQEKDAQAIRDERLHIVVNYLRDAVELLDVSQEERAVAALSALLKLKRSEVLPYLIAGRSALTREQKRGMSAAKRRQDGDQLPASEQQSGDTQAASMPQDEDHDSDTATSERQDGDLTTQAGKPMRGPVYVSLEQAVQITGYSRDHLQRLARSGVIASKKNERNKLLLSSLQAYVSKQKRGTSLDGLSATPMFSLVQDGDAIATEPVTDKLTIVRQAMQDNPAVTDEELAAILGMSRPASARFWRLKAESMRANERHTVLDAAHFVQTSEHVHTHEHVL
jgi:hypothetical protein